MVLRLDLICRSILSGLLGKQELGQGHVLGVVCHRIWGPWALVHGSQWQESKGRYNFSHPLTTSPIATTVSLATGPAATAYCSQSYRCHCMPYAPWPISEPRMPPRHEACGGNSGSSTGHVAVARAVAEEQTLGWSCCHHHNCCCMPQPGTRAAATCSGLNLANKETHGLDLAQGMR